MNDFPADFYSVAAQIIVVLFVLAAVEFKVLVMGDADAHPPWGLYGQVLMAAGLVVTATIGTASALITLYDQDSSTQRDLQIYGTMLVEILVATSMGALNWLSPVYYSRLQGYVHRERADAFIANPEAEPPGVYEAAATAVARNGPDALVMGTWAIVLSVWFMTALLITYCIPLLAFAFWLIRVL